MLRQHPAGPRPLGRGDQLGGAAGRGPRTGDGSAAAPGGAPGPAGRSGAQGGSGVPLPLRRGLHPPGPAPGGEPLRRPRGGRGRAGPASGQVRPGRRRPPRRRRDPDPVGPPDRPPRQPDPALCHRCLPPAARIHAGRHRPSRPRGGDGSRDRAGDSRDHGPDRGRLRDRRIRSRCARGCPKGRRGGGADRLGAGASG